MGKLIAAFEKNPTTRNAEKLVKYVRAHPMCWVLMTSEDKRIYDLARNAIGLFSAQDYMNTWTRYGK